jgi:TPR repeat protein
MKKILLIVALTFLASRAYAATADWRELWDSQKWRAWQAKPESVLRAEAAQGGANAMWMLAVKLYNEHGGKEAQEWRDKAAKAGSVQAITEIAVQSLHTDIRQSVKTLEQMAATGYPPAKFDLADTLIGGGIDQKFQYVEADIARAVELLQQAADERSVDAWLRLAQLYACGVGEPRNDGERPAALWLKCANAGRTEAMLEMAQRYRFGFGVDKDFLAATGWGARENFQTVRQILGGHFPEPADWVGPRRGPDEETLQKITMLFANGLLRNSRASLETLAQMHIAGENGKPNLPRAVALLTFAERAGSPSAAATRAEIERKLDDNGKEAVKRDLAWMTEASRPAQR